MNLKTYIPDGTRYQHLANAREVGVARDLLDASDKKKDEIFNDLISRPQVCNEDIKKDFRFKLGIIYGLKWILDLPGEAQKYIDHLPDEE